MSLWWVRASRGYRWRQLHHRQRIESVDCGTMTTVKELVQQGCGVLITPNHSAHYDSAALYVAADQADQPLYFMTAWQVFQMGTRFERWAMQHLGCFSVDREGNDRKAFKQAIEVLQRGSHPLVIFPEGDVYHTTDVVTPFRDGAAAIALSAAKRADRPIYIVPCGIKFWYLDDPTPQLMAVTAEIERRLFLRIAEDATLVDRIHRLAEAALALKELDYFERTREGRVRDRIRALIEAILQRLEREQTPPAGDATVPERVKVLRQRLIDLLDGTASNGGVAGETARWEREMEDLFLVMQLFSYRGDYLTEAPSIERVAETVDKFEEDILGRDLPSVRGRRRVEIEFGDPILCPADRQPRGKIVEMSREIQDSVQQIINRLNRSAPPMLAKQRGS